MVYTLLMFLNDELKDLKAKMAAGLRQ